MELARTAGRLMAPVDAHGIAETAMAPHPPPEHRDPFAGLPIDPDLAPDDPGEPHVGAAVVARPPHPMRERARPDVLAVIAAGGALGGSARIGLGLLAPDAAGRVPWTTLAINLTGSFLLGVVLVALVERAHPSRHLRPFLATGFLGGYTTFSTFAVGADRLVSAGNAGGALLYVLLSLVGGVGAALLGLLAGRRLPFHEHRSSDPVAEAS